MKRIEAAASKLSIALKTHVFATVDAWQNYAAKVIQTSDGRAPRREGWRLRELRRVLKPGGLLLMAFHLADETIHLDN